MKRPCHPNFSPPAPALIVEIFAPDAPDHRQQVLAQLDTAADISAIPLQLLSDWNVEPVSEIIVVGFDSAPMTVRTYTIGFEFPDARIRRSEVIPIASEHALIGRDILNRFYVDLRGPELVFEIRADRGGAQS